MAQQAMAARQQMLNFPNPSRSYDPAKSRVRFWGYDSAIEVSFFVEESALKKLCPKMNNVETEYLDAFDTTIKRIHNAAEKVYLRIGKGASGYNLVADDV